MRSKMLLKMAASAIKCSTFEVQYGKSTSTRTTAIKYFGDIFNRSCDFAHAHKLIYGFYRSAVSYDVIAS